MNINISDDKLTELAEQEVRKEISRRVQRVIDGGIAYYFSEQTIQRLTYECVNNMINREFVKKALENLDKDKVIKTLSDSIAKEIADRLCFD